MIPYIINVILCSVLFIGAYKLLLEKEKILLFNRLYLLACLTGSFLIPLLSIPSSTTIAPVQDKAILITKIFTEPNFIIAQTATNQTSTAFLVGLMVYAIITLILIIRFVRNLRKILFTAKLHSRLKYEKATLVLVPEHVMPHSFLSYLFVNRKDYESGMIEHEILMHEYAHVAQKHTYDILFLELMQIFFWINPFLAFYRKAMQLNHEFLADEAVINSLQNIQQYQYLLIQKASKNKAFPLTSSFHYSITKKRILMMTKTKSFSNALCRQIMILPVLVLSVFLFSVKSAAQEVIRVSKEKQKAVPSTKEGVGQELLDEYNQIVDGTKNEKGMPMYQQLSEADKKRLQTIFLLMSPEQQAKQVVGFMPVSAPFPKEVPTPEQVEAWKNAKVYGLWIDGKRVANTELNKYRNTDFAHLFVSKLSKNAINYGKHYYQVDLMTREGYQTYYRETMDRKDTYYLIIRNVSK